MSDWLSLLRDQVRDRGQAAVARELGRSRSAVSMVLSGKYPAGTDAIEAAVLALYGGDGLVPCPVLGSVEPGICAGHCDRAKRLGLCAGNPQTLRLRKACLNCSIRKP